MKCIERVAQKVPLWYLIMPLWKQWEVRHPYRCFHYALKHYGKDVGWKTFFSCSSEVVTPSAGLSQYSLVLSCSCFVSQSEGLLPCVPSLWSALCHRPLPWSRWRRCEWVKKVWMDAGVPWEHWQLRGLKKCSGCHALLRWPEVEEHTGGFLPPLSSFSSHAKPSEAAVKKSRSIVKTTGKYLCQQEDCARHEQKAQPC